MSHKQTDRRTDGRYERSGCRSYRVTPRRESSLTLADFGALGLGALDAAGVLLDNTARGITFLESMLFDLPVQGLVPAHARRILRTQMDQCHLKKGKKKKTLVKPPVHN